MRIQAKTYWLPKRGNTLEEYEDAFYPKESPEGFPQCSRFAVSDGASESMLSGPWAEVLVRAFCRTEAAVSRAFVKAMMARACAAHEAWRKEYLRRREREGRPVQWYEEPGLKDGAFATILGLSLLPSGAWEAVALGDSCLFQVRGEDLVAAFPVKQSSEFGQRPMLAASDPAKSGLALGKFRGALGTWRRGDTFYLMTDALSAWFIKQHEQGEKPWVTLDSTEGSLSGRACDEAAGPASFEALVQRLRSEGLMRNDDVTMTRVRAV